MNKEQYMIELKTHLSSLPQQERDDAISFYEEYVSDVAESTDGNLDTLDSPAQVAAQIKAEVAMRSVDQKDIKKKKGISTAWTVLLAVLALPIGVPVAIAIAAVALAMIIVALSLIISLFAVALSVVFAAIASIVAGISQMIVSPAVGIFYLGFGLLGLGLGYLISIGVYDLSKRIFIGIAKIINKMRMKIQKKNAEKREVA